MTSPVVIARGKRSACILICDITRPVPNGLLLGPIIRTLLDAGVPELTIANRTPERADALADAIGQPKRVHTRYWDDLGNWGAFDLLINATSAGHGGAALSLPSSLLAPRAVCYDLSYGKVAFGFLAWARSVGAEHALDGLGMLIEQAAEAFELWHGQRPDTDALYAELRAYVPGNAED